MREFDGRSTGIATTSLSWRHRRAAAVAAALLGAAAMAGLVTAWPAAAQTAPESVLRKSLQDAVAKRQAAERPAAAKRQIAQITQQPRFPVPPAGSFYNQDTALDVAITIRPMDEAFKACDLEKFDAGLQDLRQLAAGLPRLERGSRRPTGALARRYDDLDARNADGDLVRKEVARRETQRAEMARRCTNNAEIRGRAFSFGDNSVGNTAAAAGRSAITEAELAIKRCDQDAYVDAVANLRTDYQQLEQAALRNAGTEIGQQQAVAARKLKELIDWLMAKRAEFFRDCAKRRRPAPDTAKPDAPPPRVGQAPATPPGTPPPGGPQMPAGFPVGIFTGWLLEPWIAGAVRNNDARGHYAASDPAIASPGSGSGSKDLGNVCGGADLYFNLPLSLFAAGLERTGFNWLWVGTTQAGARFGLCGLGDGNKIVFREIRHGASGFVTISEREQIEIALIFLVRQMFFIDLNVIVPGPNLTRGRDQYASADLAQAPLAPPASLWPVALYLGAGPSLVRTRVRIDSDQGPGGGVFESAARNRWDTAFSFMIGAQTAVCSNCIFGAPLMFGIEGQWTWLPSRDVSVASSAFGFSESGRVSSRSSSRVSFKFTVPFGLGR